MVATRSKAALLVPCGELQNSAEAIQFRACVHTSRAAEGAHHFSRSKGDSTPMHRDVLWPVLREECALANREKGDAGAGCGGVLKRRAPRTLRDLAGKVRRFRTTGTQLRQSPRGRGESQNKGRQTRTLAKGVRNMVDGRHMNRHCRRHRDGRQPSNTRWSGRVKDKVPSGTACGRV